MSKKRSPNLRSDPTLLLFVAQLALNGGNASAAARAVGWSSEKGRRVVARDPELREQAKRAAGARAHEVLLEWQEIHQEARRTVAQLMRSEDGAIALKAAIYVIERVEGKAVQPIRDETPQVPLESVTMRFVASVIMYKGLSFAQAYDYAQKHPEEVEEWGRKKGLLPKLSDA